MLLSKGAFRDTNSRLCISPYRSVITEWVCVEAVVASFLSPSFSWANKLDALTRVSTSDPEGYLGHPVNAYKLMKRLNTEWTELESLVLQNPSDGREEKGNQAKTG